MLSKACEVGEKNLSFYLLSLNTVYVDQMLCGADNGHDACLLSFCYNSHFWIFHSVLGCLLFF